MTGPVGSGFERILTFGPFRLVPGRKVLLDGDVPLRLGSRALDILVVLAERAGQVVAKDELVANVWPDTHVDDANLRVNIAALRKALGDGRDGARYIANIPGRGYCFVAPITRLEEGDHPPPLAAPPVALSVPHNLPVRLTRVVGRAAIIRALAGQLPARRFITLVGPGGIGKTTVALALAEELAPGYEHGVRFVDFAPVNNATLADATLAASVLAGALGVAIDSIADLAGILRDKRLLLVLDNCEHVVGTAAVLAEAVLRGAPGVHILATSREPLLAEGEWVQRLASLETPPVTATLDAAQAMTFSAVELFVERATASVDTFCFGDAEVPLVVEICRGLDGIPLAIELAAARLDLFGLRGLAARLNDRFALLVRGRRTALPRHQTLRAMLDWSYELLPAVERAVLHRLSVFAGGFAMESAAAVAGDAALNQADVLAALANLVAKSLLVSDAGGAQITYRLLEMTRAYALEKLTESGDLAQVRRRHAECHRDLLVRAEQEWDRRPTAEWLDVHGRQVDNLRAALLWAFGPEGDASLGIALTAAAVPLWMQLSLMNECREGVRRALDQMPPGMMAADAVRGAEADRILRLLTALGLSLIYTKGPGPEIRAALNQALALAQRLDNLDYQLRALWGLFVETFNEGRYARALEISDRFRLVAARSGDPVDLMAADRIRGFALHLIGDHATARHHIEEGLRRYVRPAHRGHLVRYQYDQRVAASVPLSVILWIQGCPEQAMAMMSTAVEEARAMDHALTLGYVLATAACQVALLVGDLTATDRYVSLLQDHSTRHGLGPWAVLGRYFRHRLHVAREATAPGLAGMGAALEDLADLNFALRYVGYLGDWAECLGRAGQVREGLQAVDQALARSDAGGIRWCMPELLRVKGDLLLGDDVMGAEAYFHEALDWARRQGALSWELRAATSLARLWRGQGRQTDAHALLSGVYSRFTEGFDTADLAVARHLLAGLTQDMANPPPASLREGGVAAPGAPRPPSRQGWEAEVIPFRAPGVAC
ncbi:ATP-binding protein [Nitrospirillum iridis]|uniref:Putative ATPase/DNA-binding winged helix-turn-helix (WHTH) protein n=1 Tax=Nitrospirillum iridis TaxID=765888 RepID=A0A7X0ED90_9PROT|nr:winged helix-turn-helix domain-containing protein [Nitrospirillum iridis]MBB6251880.1 putative ATPase/DNA-binding winged helix-turn-helix (wHTH) protein [Nitrospirillum iridis]